MNYTKPSRADGCWDVEQECHDEDLADYGPVEVFKLRRTESLGKNTQRTICTIQEPDMDGIKSECGGNIALIVTAPRTYESLKRAAEMLRFLGAREQTIHSDSAGIRSEIIGALNDAESTLRHVERTYEQLMAGEHVS